GPEEKISVEVESWTTGEQYASWLLSSRGLDKVPRGWSVSMFTGETWRDLPGCDFVLDLIGEMEEAALHSRSSSDYPITPEGDEGVYQAASLDILSLLSASLPAMVMPQPAMPSMDPNQLAVQQQAFINQQALLMVSGEGKAKEPGEGGEGGLQFLKEWVEGGICVVGVVLLYWPLVNPSSSAAPAPLLLEQPPQETKAKKAPPPVVKCSEASSRVQPSQDIRNIIKMYQSRPPLEPQTTSKTFLKKNDPKEEALAKLRMSGLSSPLSLLFPQPTSSSPDKSPQSTSKGLTSRSIREKQQPLMHLFGQRPPPPPAPQIPPPPPILPVVPPPMDQAMQGTDEKGKVAALSLCGLLCRMSLALPLYSLQVFYPKETFSHPYCLNLLCQQIMRDTYSESCIRLSKEERRKMKDLLDLAASMSELNCQDGIKKRIVVAARDNWANYFSRLFPVKGENGSDVQILGISHRGLRLLKRVKASGFNLEHLKILCSYSFADVLSLEMMGRSSLGFSLKSEQLILHSAKARQIKAMVDLFLHELKKDSNCVIALRSYVTDDKSLLSFRKGDFIQLLPMEGLEPGWQFGSIGGRSGLFPSNMAQLAAAPDYLSIHMDRREGPRRRPSGPAQERGCRLQT
uniref:SH3 domain-containing protein n=1 Tax=Sphenodon punctatus TaxID=8508 RepID=A0A8D0GUI9_SPHPU